MNDQIRNEQSSTLRNWLLAGITAVAVAAVVWFLGTSEMRIVLEKMATTLVMPYGLAWLATSALVIVAIVRRDRILIVGTLVVWCLIYVGGNGYLARKFVRILETPYLATAAASSEGSYEAVIVLGGGTSVRPDGTGQVVRGGDRVISAARMYHLGRVKKIICTGSLIPSIDRFGRAQADIAEEVLVALGVDPQDVERIDGRTTAEEMDILAKRFSDDSAVGLITSAWHLPRAMRLANARGFSPDPIPSDFASTPDMRPTIRDLLPSADGADGVARCVKEWLAGAVGR